MLMSQLLSLNVTSAPVPGALEVHFERWIMKSGSLSVVVKETKVDSGVRVQKLEGLPKLGRQRDSVFQRIQEPSLEGELAAVAGGQELLVPVVDMDVIEPSVMKTTSWSWTLMTPV